MKFRNFMNRPKVLSGLGSVCLALGLIGNNFHERLGINEFFPGMLLGMSFVFLLRGMWIHRHGGGGSGRKLCGS